ETRTAADDSYSGSLIHGVAPARLPDLEGVCPEEEGRDSPVGSALIRPIWRSSARLLCLLLEILQELRKRRADEGIHDLPGDQRTELHFDVVGHLGRSIAQVLELPAALVVLHEVALHERPGQAVGRMTLVAEGVLDLLDDLRVVLDGGHLAGLVEN